MRYLIITALLLCTNYSGKAQFSNNMDMGLLLGVSYYTGDINPSYHFLQPGLAVGGLLRYNFSDRYALRASLQQVTIQGNDDLFENPFKLTRGYSFTTYIMEFGLMGEFNFFPYTGYNKKAQFTPYITAGIAGAYIANPSKQLFAPVIPFGLGFKVNVGERFNFSVAWVPRRCFTDDLEGLGSSTFDSTSPYSGKQRFFTSDQDWYYTAQFSMSVKLFGRESACAAYRFYNP